MKRPSHATDCPACDGWIGGAELLCVRCTNRVQKHKPHYYDDWLRYRANEAAAMEHYYRGLIIGSARALFEKKGARS
jgi:hypothetical protein